MTSRWFVANDGLLINLDNAEDVRRDVRGGVEVVYTSGRTRWLKEPDAMSRIRKRLFWSQPEEGPREGMWATEWNE